MVYTPTLRKVREGWGTRSSVVILKDMKLRVGHPPSWIDHKFTFLKVFELRVCEDYGNSSSDCKKASSHNKFSTIHGLLTMSYIALKNNGVKMEDLAIDVLSWQLIQPRVSSESEFREIASDFGDPLEIVREAISNAFDAKATELRILFDVQEIDGLGGVIKLDICVSLWLI